MTSPSISIVLTTINDGEIIRQYCDQIRAEDCLDRVNVIAIPDHKTPAKIFDTCHQLRNEGFQVICPEIGEQDLFLQKLGNIANLIPHNSDNRRNIGFLMALERGADVLVSIDDDNYPQEAENVFAGFGSVQEELSLPAVHSSTGWFNVCSLLDIAPKGEVYPRGFPHHKRHQAANLTYPMETGPVRLNAGLWIGEPDLDAVTWLAFPVRALSYTGENYLLGNSTWSPINTQNTSLHRDLIPAYYYIRMGYPLGGFPIDRYGDIFSGYFCQACVRHMGDRIRIGSPVARHLRNSHNYLRDLTFEVAAMLVNEDLTQWLPEVKLSGSTYSETYLSLADAIDEQVEKFTGMIWTDATRGYLHQVAYHMREWRKTCKTITG